MTKIKSNSIALIPVLAILLLFSACIKPKPVNKAEVASSFIQAINQNDTDMIVKLSATPLSIRNQAWEAAPDGKGLLLGKSKDEYLLDKSRIKNYFSENIKKIHVEDINPTGTTIPPLIKDELRGVIKRWEGLDVHLYLRSMDNVEHIFVLGINEKGMVAAIYFN